MMNKGYSQGSIFYREVEWSRMLEKIHAKRHRIPSRKKGYFLLITFPVILGVCTLTDHQLLKCSNSQKKLNPHHASWSE